MSAEGERPPPCGFGRTDDWNVALENETRRRVVLRWRASGILRRVRPLPRPPPSSSTSGPRGSQAGTGVWQRRHRSPQRPRRRTPHLLAKAGPELCPWPARPCRLRGSRFAGISISCLRSSCSKRPPCLNRDAGLRDREPEPLESLEALLDEDLIGAVLVPPGIEQRLQQLGQLGGVGLAF